MEFKLCCMPQDVPQVWEFPLFSNRITSGIHARSLNWAYAIIMIQTSNPIDKTEGDSNN